MTLYLLSKLIHTLYREEKLRSQFRREPEKVILTFGLSKSEADLIMSRDYLGLYAMGLHPILLYHLVEINGDREKFIKEVVPKLASARNTIYDFYLD